MNRLIETLGGLLLLVVLACFLSALLVGQGSPVAATVAPSSVGEHTDSDHIVGTPTLTADYIHRVLVAAASPAQALGDDLYALSVQYHIDDAFALAFFHHESSYGTRGVAVSTHSLGNIRCTRGYACDPSGGYRSYATWAQGAEDWYKLIASVYLADGRTTVSTIIPKYAPQQDHNDEQAYIRSVCGDVARYRRGEVHA